MLSDLDTSDDDSVNISNIRISYDASETTCESVDSGVITKVLGSTSLTASRGGFDYGEGDLSSSETRDSSEVIDTSESNTFSLKTSSVP